MTGAGRVWVAVAAAIVIVGGGAFLIGGLTSRGHHRDSSGSLPVTSLPPPAPSTPPGSSPSSAASGSTTSPSTAAATGPVAVPVVSCPTTYGVNGLQLGPVLPKKILLDEPKSIAGQLAFYSNDDRELTPILAPRGWHCNVQVGADASTGVAVYPGSQPSSTSAGGPNGQPFVQASSGGACQGCIYGMVCGLIPAAGPQLGYGPATGFSCDGRPSGETVDWIKGSATHTAKPVADVVGYSDPTNPDATNGVLIYAFGSTAFGGGQASVGTCTLEGSEHGLCTVILNRFIDADWLIR